MRRGRVSWVVAVAAVAAGAIGPVQSAAAKPKLPPVGHVFTIVLENKDYEDTFGNPSPAPYLAKTLPSKGQLLSRYHGTGHRSLGNYLTMISGQSENPATQFDCVFGFNQMTPGTIGKYGQAEGTGCVFPARVQTIADQLEAEGLTWRAYMEDMGDDPVRDHGTNCAHPEIGGTDTAFGASPTDQYATKHNPFMYFHSVIDHAKNCAKHDVNLDELTRDLAKPKRTPNYAFITPDLCSDGHDDPCADPSQPGGYAGINAFLHKWVPKILKSKAYKRDGLLIVTFDEEDNDGTPASATSCCFTPTGPNVAQQGDTGPGGGLVGAVLLSPFIKAGTVNDQPYNHYDLLHTLEDIFGLKYLGYAAHPKVDSFGKDVFGK